MSYIDLIKAFERWCETNYLPISSQLLWYKLISLFNSCGWSEWVTVDNQRLMSKMQIKNEKTFIKCRDKLIEAGLFFYKKGKKGSPNQYKINTVIFTVQNTGQIENNNNTVKNTVQSTVHSTVESTVESTDINRLRQRHIYINLFNKYKDKIKTNKFSETIKVISELKNEQDYDILPEDKQDELFLELMSFNNIRS